MITDKVVTQNSADVTFVCGKVPFAVSCSSDLPHKDCNIIDLDLINKMKIPLKNIRVTRISIQGNDLRCVGVISQTIQCMCCWWKSLRHNTSLCKSCTRPVQFFEYRLSGK